MDYTKQLEHVKQQTASDKAIQRMNATRAPSQQQTEVVNQIIGQLRPTVSVTKEQRLAEPVVKSERPATLPDTAATAVDQLTKAFERLSVNLLQQVQSQQQPYSQTYGRYPRYGQQPPVNPLTDDPKRPQNATKDDFLSVNVGAYAAKSQGAFGRLTGVC